MPSTTCLHVELSLPFPFTFCLAVLSMVQGSSLSGVLSRYLIHCVVVLDATSIFNDHARALCTDASTVFLPLVLVTSRTLYLVGPITLPFALSGSIALPLSLIGSSALQVALADVLPLPAVAIPALPGLRHRRL